MSRGFSIDLRGRRALVTGGSRGVGRATALMLAKAGADVVVGYRSRSDEAYATVREVVSLGVRSAAVQADLADPGGADELFDRAEKALGGLDIFIGNAGIWPDHEVPIAEMDEAQWSRTIEVNLNAIFRCVRLAAARLSDGGRIVLVSSTAAQRGEAFHADYAASKGALGALAKSVAVELAPRAITVNVVAPGWIDTEMVARPFSQLRARIESEIPLKRVATPADVAGPIVFLCSELARHVTGEILNVNGGSVLCG